MTLGTGVMHFLSIREPKRKRNLKLDNRDGLATRAEIHNLLAKGATEVVPLEECGTGFYSHYFLVPKKDGGFALF